MTTTLEELYFKAIDLSEEERTDLVRMLLASLGPDDGEGVAAAWQREIARRTAELDSGAVESIPWTEARSRIFRQS